MMSRYMTSSGVAFTEPFYYFGCIIIRHEQNVVADVMLHAGADSNAPPIWRYVLGIDDPRSIRLLRTQDDAVLIEVPIYAHLSPDTTFIVYYRPVQPL